MLVGSPAACDPAGARRKPASRLIEESVSDLLRLFSEKITTRGGYGKIPLSID